MPRDSLFADLAVIAYQVALADGKKDSQTLGPRQSLEYVKKCLSPPEPIWHPIVQAHLAGYMDGLTFGLALAGFGDEILDRLQELGIKLGENEDGR